MVSTDDDLDEWEEPEDWDPDLTTIIWTLPFVIRLDETTPLTLRIEGEYVDEVAFQRNGPPKVQLQFFQVPVDSPPIGKTVLAHLASQYAQPDEVFPDAPLADGLTFVGTYDEVTAAVAPETEMWVETVVEATTPTPLLVGEESTGTLGRAHRERALYALNRFVHAYAVATEDPRVHFVTMEQLDPLHVWIDDAGPEGESMVHVKPTGGHPPAGRSAPAGLLTETEHERLTINLVTETQDHPMDNVRLWWVRARRLFEFEGDYEGGIVSLQTSAETLLYASYRFALIDQGLDGDEISEKVAGLTFKSLLTKELPALFGGNWSIDKKGSVGTYWNDLYLVRNRIAHAGAHATVKSSIAALEAYDGLQEHLFTRVGAKASKFPHTAFSLMGAPGLRDRGLLSKRLQAWAAARPAGAPPVWLPQNG